MRSFTPPAESRLSTSRSYPHLTRTFELRAMDYKSFPCNGAWVWCRLSTGASVVSSISMKERAMKHEAMSAACFCFDI